jgi:chlorite dismutase
MSDAQHATETLEGWFVLHAGIRLDRRAWRLLEKSARDAALEGARAVWRDCDTPPVGWSRAAHLVSGSDEVMLMHVRPTLDDVACAQRALLRTRFGDYLRSEWSFASVTEVGLFHLTERLVAETTARGGLPGDDEYRVSRDAYLAAERSSIHVQRRLFPAPPNAIELPYVSFYPMSKRRLLGQNWYTLPIGERAVLMRAHGLTGRRHAGRIAQMITGAVGLADWEWGVTIFGREPTDIKRLVTEMRYDTATAQYADFGSFRIGRLAEGTAWIDALGELAA